MRLDNVSTRTCQVSKGVLDLGRSAHDAASVRHPRGTRLLKTGLFVSGTSLGPGYEVADPDPLDSCTFVRNLPSSLFLTSGSTGAITLC